MHDDAIGISWSQRPAAAKHLPHDSEVHEWRRKHEWVLKERTQTLALLDQHPEPRNLEAVQLEQEISQLEYSDANLLTALGPRSKDWLKGGICGVGWDASFFALPFGRAQVKISSDIVGLRARREAG